MCRCNDYHGLISVKRRKKLQMGFIAVRLLGATSAQLPQTLSVRIEEKNEIDSSPAFVSLQRRGGEASFASRESVAISEGATFEVFLRDEKLLQGILRPAMDGESDWVMEFASLCSSEIQLTVSAEGHVVAVRQVMKRSARRRRFEGLQRIPEETEYDCGVVGSDGGYDSGVEIEGVGWAVDVAIWVFSLGVGLLVSKASSKALRRTRLL